MQIGTAALHSCAEPGQKKKVHCGTFLFWISKEGKKKKKIPWILFIPLGINSAYYNQL